MVEEKFLPSSDRDFFCEAVLLEQLLAIENAASTNNCHHLLAANNHCLRIAVGFGSCRDQFVRAVDFFRVFGIDHQQNDPLINKKTLGRLHPNYIESRQQLEQMFLFYFTKGVAAERFVSNKTLFKEISDTIKVNKLSYKEDLGGNAPLMSGRFAKDACQVFLGSAIGRKLHKIANVSPSINVLDEDSDCEDVHILMEYDVNDVIGTNRSPRANRFIVHSDNNNPKISMLERFFDGLPAFKPHLIVIGGLQMMDNCPWFGDGEMSHRLKQLGDYLAQSYLANTLVHFELASFTDPELMAHLTDRVITASDSLGINEQELANLASYLSTGQVTLAEDAYVSLDIELEKIRSVFINLESRPRTRTLTRLHLHTLLFQVIVTRFNGDKEPWRNGHLAVARASLTATRFASQSDTIDLSKVKLLFRGPVTLPETSEQLHFSAKTPVISWTEKLTNNQNNDSGIILDFCVTPVLVSTEVKQTTGGGDNISPIALVAQLNHKHFTT